MENSGVPRSARGIQQVRVARPARALTARKNVQIEHRYRAYPAASCRPDFQVRETFRICLVCAGKQKQKSADAGMISCIEPILT